MIKDEILQSVACPCCGDHLKVIRDENGLLRLKEYPSSIEAFEALAKAAGSRWDNIDPTEYVRELRAD